MEIIKQIRINGRTADMWRSRDAEGRTTYAISFPRPHGMRIQPTVAHFYSQKAAIENAQQMLRLKAESEGRG